MYKTYKFGDNTYTFTDTMTIIETVNDYAGDWGKQYQANDGRRYATLLQKDKNKDVVMVNLEWDLFGEGLKTPTYFEPWTEMTKAQAEDLADRFVNGKGRWA